MSCRVRLDVRPFVCANRYSEVLTNQTNYVQKYESKWTPTE